VAYFLGHPVKGPISLR